ncbi:heavy metal-responsive transcriptional regulator [Methylobacterium nigriterrae]|uniref:heavy metal-responsive transcriptional regulator n=1 Tax=Methylobacterium nigriterrae TaxID=3127512 RepID=UPI003013BFC9
MFTIGKLADAAGTTTDTIRFYEREGLLRPAGRSGSSYRLYDQEAVTRLRFVRHAQACGFTLAEVRDLLALRQREGACCGDVRTQALEKQRQLQAQIRTLQAMSATLDHLIADCTEVTSPIADCPIVAAFDAALTTQGFPDGPQGAAQARRGSMTLKARRVPG